MKKNHEIKEGNSNLNEHHNLALKVVKPNNIGSSHSVVSRDSVRIAFLLAALNSLDIHSCDIQNGYLSAPCREFFYHIAGDEFGTEKSKVFIAKVALYGLRTSGAAFCTFLAESSSDMGFKPYNIVDPDVQIRENYKFNGHKYYAYFLAYVDDLLLVFHDAK